MIATSGSDKLSPGAALEAGCARLIPAGAGWPYVLISSLFFLWGVPNGMNDVLIRQFMKSFALSRFEAGLVQFAFYMGYFVLALPAGLLMKRFGYKAGFLTGLCLLGAGCLLFQPAASVGSYGYFLVALFVVASGLAFLETASNPFIAQLGPSVTSERRLNLAQAFNPLGVLSAILIGTIFIFSGIELTPGEIAAKQAVGTYAAYMHMETLRVVRPYLVIGCCAFVWALMIALTKFPSFVREREHGAEVSGDWRKLLRQPNFLLAVLAQFLQCGAQVCMWSYFIQYAKDYTLQTDKHAGFLFSFVLVIFGVGRFASTALMQRFSAAGIMMVYGLVNAALLLVSILFPDWTGVVALMSTAFFLSVMFPTIFAMGLKDLGPNTNIGGSFIVMGIVGGAVLPPLMGLLADKLHSTAHALILPLLGMLAVAAYARYMSGYNARRALLTNPSFYLSE